jgi:hypothetical protein
MENNCQLRKKTQFKVKAFIYDFYAKIEANNKFSFNDLVEHHKISKNIREIMRHKYEIVTLPLNSKESKYKWVGNEPSENDIMDIGQKMYTLGKYHNDKRRELLNEKNTEFNKISELDALKLQIQELTNLLKTF